MRTLNELINIKDKLLNKQLSISDVKIELWQDYKEGNRSWNKKDWKDRRTELLKDKCEICSSTVTLTIQHLSHPLKFVEYRQEMSEVLTSQYLDSNPVIDPIEFVTFIQDNYNFAPPPQCPECSSKKLSKRDRKKPRYLCTECRYEFDTPFHEILDALIDRLLSIDGPILDHYKYFIAKDLGNKPCTFGQVKYWAHRTKFQKINAEDIEFKSLLIYLDHAIKYLSFNDSITACKKCASYYDLYAMDLCPLCMTNYKGRQYKSCIPCLPEQKRIVAMEKIESGRKFNDMHKELGID